MVTSKKLEFKYGKLIKVETFEEEVKLNILSGIAQIDEISSTGRVKYTLAGKKYITAKSFNDKTFPISKLESHDDKITDLYVDWYNHERVKFMWKGSQVGTIIEKEVWRNNIREVE